MLATSVTSRPGAHTVDLPRLRRSALAMGATALLDRPMVAVTGARHPDPASCRFAQRAARALARAGLVVGALAQTRLGRVTLAETVRAGGAILGMLHAAIPVDFAPPTAAASGSALWLSIFPTSRHASTSPPNPVFHDPTWEGPDAADRVLGKLASAVIVIDGGGLPDAFYIAESAIWAGSPVFLSRAAAERWPSPLHRPNVHVGHSLPAILRTLTLSHR